MELFGQLLAVEDRFLFNIEKFHVCASEQELSNLES